MSDEAKREFLTKLVTAAGAVAAAGVLSGGGSADGATLIHKGVMKFTCDKHKGGFILRLSGPELGNALQRANLLTGAGSLDEVCLTLSWSWGE